MEEKKSSVTIVVYAESQNDIDRGIQNLENLLNKDFHKKDFQDEVIHEFTANQVCLRPYLVLLHVIELKVFKD